jgi:endodeoxyribonuclease RusA
VIELARFFVEGRPRTKGSLTPQLSRGKGGRLVVHLKETGEFSVPWKNKMIGLIRERYDIKPIKVGNKVVGFEPEPYAYAVEVSCSFRFQREMGVDGKVIPSHDVPHPTAIDIGDCDKLVRNLLDALTQSGLIKDDSLVVGGSRTWKRWCRGDEKPGVEVVIHVARDPGLIP